jgi:hypothetical protein
LDERVLPAVGSEFKHHFSVSVIRGVWQSDRSHQRRKTPMPKVFEKDGYKFFFYSNDHRPIHVHVRRGDGEAVFNVEESVQLRESQNMTIRELSKAQRLAQESRQLILE